MCPCRICLFNAMQKVLDTLSAASTVYGRRNMRMLCDALSTLAEAVGRALGEPAHLHAIMPALMTKWHALSDAEPELLPLLECLMTIATAVGKCPPHTSPMSWHRRWPFL
jgi:transportin-1